MLMDKQGFTLIELMVAISIFTIVAVIATGAILTANDINKKSQAIKVVVDNLNFALDSMTLKLKQGGGYYCSGVQFASNPPIYPSSPTSLDCPNGDTALGFKVEDGDDYDYYVYRFQTDANNLRHLEFSKRIGPSGAMSSFVPITADAVVILGGKFYVSDNNQPNKQPQARISLYGVSTAGKQISDFAVETAVSDRR